MNLKVFVFLLVAAISFVAASYSTDHSTNRRTNPHYYGNFSNSDSDEYTGLSDRKGWLNRPLITTDHFGGYEIPSQVATTMKVFAILVSLSVGLSIYLSC
jgi:hypothetical protein